MRFYLLACLLALAGFQYAQAQGAKADRFVTITIAVVNSEKAYHVAFVRYFDKDGEILLNTSEEYKIDISKASRFKTGSIRKTIPIFPEAHRVEVTISGCSSLHENFFLVSDLDAAQNEVTFVFKREFETMTVVRFKGINPKKPCSFQIKGKNTNIIYYGDYVDARKELPAESSRESIGIEIAESTLFPYKIVSVKKDVDFKIDDKERYIDVTVQSLDDPQPQTAVTDTTAVETKPAVDPRLRRDGESKKDWKKRLKELDEAATKTGGN